MKQQDNQKIMPLTASYLSKLGFSDNQQGHWIKWFDRFVEARNSDVLSKLMIHHIGQMSTQYYEDPNRENPIIKQIDGGDINLYLSREEDLIIIPHLHSLSDITDEHIISTVKLKNPHHIDITEIGWTRKNTISYTYTIPIAQYKNYAVSHIDFEDLSPLQVHHLCLLGYDVFSFIESGMAFNIKQHKI